MSAMSGVVGIGVVGIMIVGYVEPVGDITWDIEWDLSSNQARLGWDVQGGLQWEMRDNRIAFTLERKTRST